MFNGGFWLIVGGFITLIFLLPVSILLLYISISIKQWIIGRREDNSFKKQGAVKTLVLLLAVLIFVIWLWQFVLRSL